MDGIGGTPELSLRVSVATLVRVLFQNPNAGEWMLALERKATLHRTQDGRIVKVKSQPFGGAVRIRDLNLLPDLIGDFRFDNEHSQNEQDFRIFIRPSAWNTVREFCIQRLSCIDDPILETDPRRELVEEFSNALMREFNPEQFVCKPVVTLVENNAVSTDNFYSKGSPTVRVYRIFETSITDSSLVDALLNSSQSILDDDLRELALADFHNGGNGWANGVLTLSWKGLADHYLSEIPEEHNKPFLYEKHLVDDSVSAILEGILVPKYQQV